MTWNTSELSEIAEYIGRGKSPAYDNESAFPVLNQACIQHGTLDLSKLKFVSEVHFDSLDEQKKTRQGDIFVNSTGTGTLGRIAYWDSDTAIAYDSHVTLVRVYPEHEPKFFYYLLQTPEVQTQILNNCISGSTNQVELSREPFCRIRLRHPDTRQEQAAIAEILTTVDRAIAQTEASLAKQRRIKAGLLHDLLTRGIDEDGRLRDVHQVQARLSEFAEINPRRPQLNMGEYESVSFIPMSDVTESARWANRQTRPLHEVIRGYTYFQENDVLVAKITPCAENGKGCLARGLVSGIGFGSTEFHVLRARDNADAGFLYHLSTYKAFRDQAAAQMTGSAGQQRVPENFLVDFLVPAFSKDEQAKIAAILDVHDNFLIAEEAAIEKLHRLRSGVMQDLLTGTVPATLLPVSVSEI